MKSCEYGPRSVCFESKTEFYLLILGLGLYLKLWRKWSVVNMAPVIDLIDLFSYDHVTIRPWSCLDHMLSLIVLCSCHVHLRLSCDHLKILLKLLTKHFMFFGYLRLIRRASCDKVWVILRSYFPRILYNHLFNILCSCHFHL